MKQINEHLRLIVARMKEKPFLLAIFILFLIILGRFLFETLLLHYKKTPEQQSAAIQKENVANFLISKDEGQHDELQSEWWYFAGHLQETGKPDNKFGTTLVFYKNPSVLFNLTNGPAQKSFSLLQKFDKYDDLGKNDLNIAIGKNYWKKLSDGRYEINFETGDKKINLQLKSLKNPLIYFLSGNEFYYQQTRMDVTGNISFGNQQYAVNGIGWVDHQGFKDIIPWKSWHWQSLQLDSNTEIVFSTHLVSKTGNVYKKGRMTIFKDTKETLDMQDYDIKELEYWFDKDTNINYPIKWNLTIPSKKVDLIIESIVPDQTIKNGTLPKIYEGTCLVSGTFDDKPITGRSQFEIVP